MRLEEKVKAVLEVFRDLEREISLFKQRTKLSCKDGCIDCCLKPDIEVSVLEFLPLAWYLSNQGGLEYWLKKLEQADSSHCVFLKKEPPDLGCSFYKLRGLICRLFGFSFILDKRQRPQLLCCPFLKDKFSYSIIKQLQSIPVASHYSMRLIAIDPYLGTQVYQINIAVLKAIELVGTHLRFKKAA